MGSITRWSLIKKDWASELYGNEVLETAHDRKTGCTPFEFCN